MGTASSMRAPRAQTLAFIRVRRQARVLVPGPLSGMIVVPRAMHDSTVLSADVVVCSSQVHEAQAEVPGHEYDKRPGAHRRRSLAERDDGEHGVRAEANHGEWAGPQGHGG
jgi:hypothetical protein